MPINRSALRILPFLILGFFSFALGNLFFPLPTLSLLDSETLGTLSLTLRYSVLALLASWLISLSLVEFKSKAFYSVFKFFWVMPSFAYALMVLFTLRLLQVQDRYSMHSVFFAWVLAGVPFLSLAISQARADLDPREKEALQSLGARPFQVWVHLHFVRILPSQFQALLQQFWLYLTSFSLVMILSGGPPNETLEVAIFTSIRLDQVNLARALSLSIWQAAILVGLRLGLQFLYPSHPTVGLEWGIQSAPEKQKWIKRIFGSISLVLLILIVQTRDLNLDGLLPSLLTGIGLAVLVSFSTFAFCVLCYRSGLRFIAEMGAWISPMVLTLAWWKLVAFQTPAILSCTLIQVVLFSPWIARTLFPLLDRARVFELEAAQSLGASPAQAWLQVEWPRVKDAVWFSLGLLFFLSINEVTAVLLFSKGDFEPLSVWVQNAFFRFRIEEGLVGTLILIFISYLAMDRGSKTA